jgi:uncharacterized protein YndB with AHSA1/START domain
MSGFTITRELAAPPERVWAAFTDATQYAAWIWPPDWQTECEIDARVGGKFRVASPTMALGVTGTYVTVDPYTDLALTWQWGGAPELSHVSFTFEPTATGTRVTLVHDGFVDDEARANHEQGWSDCLDRLPGYLAR